ncbi:MAG TPA: hypothetical protein VM432_12775 [Bdellovibrionales bacterium]|nr:hypothetical protein [Bdellovibrionales bacterium]
MRQLYSVKPRNSNAKAIVVDALPEYQLLLKTMIKSRLGLDVLVATTAEDALQLLKENLNEIQFVISDVVFDSKGTNIPKAMALQSSNRVKFIHFAESDICPDRGLTVVVKTDLSKLLWTMKT